MPTASGADQHVAHPHGVRVGPRRVRITLQRTLVRHVRAAVRLGVVDQQPRLEVLAVVGEVQAEQLGVAARAVEADPSREPHQVAAEGDRDVAQHGVLAQSGVVGADVHGIVGPVGDRDDRQAGRVVDHEFDVVGVDSAAALVDDDDGLGQLADPHLQMPVGHRALPRSGDGDVDLVRGLGVLVDCDDRRGVERRKRLSGNPVGGHPALPESLVAAAHLLDRHTGAFGDLDTGAAGGWGGAVVQAAQSTQRGEPPELVTAVRHLEGVDVE